MIREHKDEIVQTVSRLLVPPIQLFALYVIAHGHYSPGGGFQGGCILGASFILLVIAYDVPTVKKHLSERLNTVLTSLGVMIYAGIGLVCLLLGANFLDYAALGAFLPGDPARVRALGTFGVEIGVGITVFAVMVSIFLNLASAGRHEKGPSL